MAIIGYVKVCSSCDLEKPLSEFPARNDRPRGCAAICKECNARRVRLWRETSLKETPEVFQKRRQASDQLKYSRHADTIRQKAKGYRQQNPDKVRAHNLLNRAIKRGEIIKPQACQKCGRASKRIIGHHEDYSRPYDVEWLCPSCHRKGHLEEVRECLLLAQ